MVDERDALDHGDPRRHGEEDDDECEHPSVERETEERLRHREQHHALGSLQHSYLRVETERFRTGPRVRGEERPDDAGETHHDHRYAAVRRTQRVKHPEAAKHGTISEAIEGGIEKRAECRATIRAPRDRAVQHVEQRRESKEEAADRDVPRAVDDSARDGARGADRCDGVWMNSTPDQPVRDRIDDAQIPVFQPVRQNFHSVPSRRIASGPAGDVTNNVAIEPPPGRARRQGRKATPGDHEV